MRSLVLLVALFPVLAFALPNPEQILVGSREKFQLPVQVLWADGWQGYADARLQYYLPPMQRALTLASTLQPPDLRPHPFNYRDVLPTNETELYIVFANSRHVRATTREGYVFEHELLENHNSRIVSIEMQDGVRSWMGAFLVFRLDRILQIEPTGPHAASVFQVRLRMFHEFFLNLYSTVCPHLEHRVLALGQLSDREKMLMALNLGDLAMKNYEWLRTRTASLPEDERQKFSHYYQGAQNNLRASRVAYLRTVSTNTVVPIDNSNWGTGEFFARLGAGERNTVENAMRWGGTHVQARLAKEPKSLYHWDRDYFQLFKKEVVFHTITSAEEAVVIPPTAQSFSRTSDEALSTVLLEESEPGFYKLHVYFLMDRIFRDQTGALRPANECFARWGVALAQAHYGFVNNYLKGNIHTAMELVDPMRTLAANIDGMKGASAMLEELLEEGRASTHPAVPYLSYLHQKFNRELVCALRIAAAGVN